MNKLNHLYFKLCYADIASIVSPFWLYFTDPVTGQPSTIIEYEDKLIVSGNKPGGGVHRYDDADNCFNHTFCVNAHG